MIAEEYAATVVRCGWVRRLALCVTLALACRGEVATHRPDFAPRLATLAVTDGNYYRSVLYTWTSPAQVAALRQSRVLLTATTATGGFVSPFLRELAVTATHDGPGKDLARLLLTDPALSRRRYAWPAPYATVLGVGARSYGTSLIQVDLRDDAWIGRYEATAANPFEFVDSTNAVVSTSEVLAHPERIGAIFHVRIEDGAAIREYVICNAAMLAGWSVATQDIQDELDRDIAMLGAIARVRGSQPTWLADWHASLAFDLERYQPTPAALATLATGLGAYDPAGEPLEVMNP
jgi:hypothetical protein